MPEAAFTFIDNSSIDKKSRQAIRSHVMKGKNVGKVRVPRQRQLIRRAAPQSEAVPSSTSTGTELVPNRRHTVYELQDEAPRLAWQVGNSLSGVSPVCQLTPKARSYAYSFLQYVKEAVYPPEICYDYEIERSIWFQYLMTDRAYFHSFVALSQASVEFLLGHQDPFAKGCNHIAVALNLINQKLSSEYAISDVTLASVISLCLLSDVREVPAQTKIHFDGLCRMIQLRGGLEQLQSNDDLVEKAQEIDVDLAFQLGCPTRLRRTTKPLDAILPGFHHPALHVSSPLLDAIKGFDDIEAELLETATDILRLSHIFNTSATAKKLRPKTYHDLLTTLRYRVLAISPIGGAGTRLDGRPVAAAIHLGLAAFTMSFVAQFGRERRLRFSLFSTEVRQAFDQPAVQFLVDPETRLWLLLVTGISVLEDGRCDRGWLSPRVALTVEELGQPTWERVRQEILCRFPWVGVLHDKPARELWTSAGLRL